MKKNPVLAVAGATGLVGSEMISILNELKLEFSEVRLLASENSKGEVYSVCGDEVAVEVLDEAAFEGVDYALFATDAELSKVYVPLAVKAGAVAIDNSSFFRMQEGVPLVVPEVNYSSIGKEKVIANPNCSTIQLVPVLHALHNVAGLKRVIVSTYQSVSGAGKGGLDELWEQTRDILNMKEVVSEAFAHQIAFNCIPQIDVMLEDGYTKEEYKIINESRKILSLPELAITATAVRVPVLHAHAESVNIELERELVIDEFIAALSEQEGIEVHADPMEYPMQISSANDDLIHVGRIRRDPSVKCGYNLWVVADNLRKGAALNAVQILKRLLDGPGLS